MKRTPLVRDTSKAREWSSGRRTRLKSRGASRKADRPSEDKPRVREAVKRRDGFCLMFVWEGAGPCRFGETYHHRRKASSGGAYVEANIVLLCAYHNDLIEDEPGWFVGEGRYAGLQLVVREGDPEWEQLGRRANR